MIFADFAKALAQLPDPRLRRILWTGIGLTLALLVATYAGIIGLINLFTTGPVTLPFIGPVTWFDDLLGWGSLGLMLLFSVFLMIPIASAITSFYLEDVAEAVEAKHYPALTAAPRTGFFEGLRDTFSFLGLMLVANLLAVAIYFMVPPLAPFVFYSMNGYLLGREYFQVAALRREGRVHAKAMQRKHSATIWIAGVLMAVPLSIPIVNLVVPILGAATFTHLYHRLRIRQGGPARQASGQTSQDRGH